MLYSLLKMSGVYKLYSRYLRNQIKRGEHPKHVGLILDGNRRWGKSTNNPRWLAHLLGADNAEDVVNWCNELGIRTVTLYVLSTENIQRENDELKELYNLIEERLRRMLEDDRIHDKRIRVKGIGRLEYLPSSIRDLLDRIDKMTEKYDNYFLNIALAYGGRTEILDVMKIIAHKSRRGEIEPSEINAKFVEENLYTAHLPNPEPDLIIRTSGEERLSGFLLWQSAYSEFVFLDVYWPDFRKIDLMRVIRTYQKRSRRIGK